MSRSLAKIGVGISLCAVAALILSMGNSRMYLVNMLGLIAAGINLYFVGQVLRALGWYDRKLAMRSPKLLDWVLMLAMAEIGLGFNCLLAFIHSGYRAPAKDRTT
jgi:hypothetical protein